jgi:hypothetical protein
MDPQSKALFYFASINQNDKDRSTNKEFVVIFGYPKSKNRVVLRQILA